MFLKCGFLFCFFFADTLASPQFPLLAECLAISHSEVISPEWLNQT